VPWCQILLDDDGVDDGRPLTRMVRNVPLSGDLIDLDGQKVLVTSVSHIPPRRIGSGAAGGLSVLIYCRQQ
jgi:hypothetical protein